MKILVKFHLGTIEVHNNVHSYGSCDALTYYITFKSKGYLKKTIYLNKNQVAFIGPIDDINSTGDFN